MFSAAVPYFKTFSATVPISGFRLSVDYSAYLAAFPSLRLYNASSAPGVSPAFVDYPFPVAVGATLRVVRLNSRTPMRRSSAAIA